jgi:hypothetical protein
MDQISLKNTGENTYCNKWCNHAGGWLRGALSTPTKRTRQVSEGGGVKAIRGCMDGLHHYDIICIGTFGPGTPAKVKYHNPYTCNEDRR